MFFYLFVFFSLVICALAFYGMFPGKMESANRLAFWFVVPIALSVILAVLSGSKRPEDMDRSTKNEIRLILIQLIEKKIPRSRADINALTEAYFAAQEEFDVAASLLISIGYYESKFRLDAVGDGGRSIGIMQVGRQGRRRCAEYCGKNETEKEQVMCGGCWLRENVNWCKTLYRGMTGYACGKCIPPLPVTARRVQYRFDMSADLLALVESNSK